jgi:hypothetical protein
VLTLLSAISPKVNRMNVPTRALLVPVTLVALVSACGSGSASVSPPTSGATESASWGAESQVSDGGGVTVKATWAGPTAGATFEVALDTHSGNLDALTLADARLRNDRGEQLAATGWDAPNGGHHRAGTLSFAGNPAPFFAGARWVELVVRGVGDLPERLLRWDLAK